MKHVLLLKKNLKFCVVGVIYLLLFLNYDLNF